MQDETGGSKQHLVDEVRALEAEQERLAGRIATLGATVRAIASSNGRSLHRAEMRNMVWEILRNNGPLHRREIYRRLIEADVSIAGKNPVDNLGAHMSGDARFLSRGKGVWGLRT